MDFKRRLSDAIARAGLADGEVADRLRAAGFDASHDRVYRWRRGRSLPGVDELPAVAEALGADLTWLATGRRDTGTLDPEEATALVVLRSLRLPLDEAIRRLSTPAPAPPASLPIPPRPGDAFPAQPEPAPDSPRAAGHQRRPPELSSFSTPFPTHDPGGRRPAPPQRCIEWGGAAKLNNPSMPKQPPHARVAAGPHLYDCAPFCRRQQEGSMGLRSLVSLLSRPPLINLRPARILVRGRLAA